MEKNNRVQFSVIEKELLANIIYTLKLIRPTDFDGMNRLVGCVLTLERAYNDPLGAEFEKNYDELMKGPPDDVKNPTKAEDSEETTVKE